jgi:hypothetical protein
MSTINGNGILFYEVTDDVAPLETMLNTGQLSVSEALDATARIFPVADVAARTALAAAYSPSASNPLYVDRANAPTYGCLERTADGTTWTSVLHGAWTAYTPALSAATGSWSLGGAGAVNSCAWRYEGELVRVRFLFVLGTGFTFPTADPRFTLPVTAVTPAHPFAIYNGMGSGRDVTVSGREDMFLLVSANTSATIAQIVAGSNPVSNVGITPTTPWTWAVTHALQGEFTYRPAP